jgi:hypothetical protein
MSSPAEHLGSAEQSLWAARQELQAAALESADADRIVRIAALSELVEGAFRGVRELRERVVVAQSLPPPPVPELG